MQDACITTNHYLSAPTTPVSDAGDSSLTRFNRLQHSVERTMTPDTAWMALAEVASSDQRFPTLHAIVVYPELRRLDFAFATWRGRVIPATESKPKSIDFDKLFGRTP